MKIAIFGLGSIGKRHLKNVADFGGHEILAHDPNVPIEPYMVTDARLIWEWKPEIVLVCTPPHLHGNQVEMALDVGAHVFCEKPLGTAPGHAHDLAITAMRRNLRLAIGHQLRWQVDDFVGPASGEDNILYACVQDMSKWPSQYVKDTLEEFSHELDLAQYVKGPVESVMAKNYGTLWNINLRHLQGYSFVRLDSAAPMNYRKAKTDDKSIHWEFDQAKNDQAYKQEMAAFIEACQGKPWNSRLCNGFEAAHVCRIIDACRESAKHCKVVRI